MLTPASIPVLMYHGVAPDAPDRPPHMDHWMTPARLAEQLAWFKRNRVETLFLSQLLEIRIGQQSMPRRAVVLTFDDGYLDFWLWVYPLLQAYETKATVFVSLDFVEGETPPRRLPEDYPWGFLSWPELVEMEASGLVDVQSHAVTHTWYPTGPKLIDVHRPDLPWKTLRSLWWNRYPARKPHWYRCGSHADLPWGLPILENEKALLARRYFLNPEIENRMVETVTAKGACYFEKPDWFDRYRTAYERAIAGFGERAGHREGEDERIARITDELRLSREQIGVRLGKEVRFLCCPGGSLSAEVMEISKKVGYDAVSIPPRFQHELRLNRPGGDSRGFYRTSPRSVFQRIQSDRANAFSVGTYVGSQLNIPGARATWLLLRVASKSGLI